MTHDTTRHLEVIHEAMQVASSDYYRWSAGGILYDHGVEALLQVYIARGLFAAFGEIEGTVVRMERRCRDLVPDEAGRFDLTFEGSQLVIAIECKRYSSAGNIGNDLARLRRFASAPNRIGLLAAPCYMKDHEGSRADWPCEHARHHQEAEPREDWHLSDKRALAARHPDGWTHERALIIRV